MCKSYPSGRTPWRRPPPLCVAWRSGSLDCWSRWRESSILELHPIDNNTKFRQDTREHRKLEFYCCDMWFFLYKYGWSKGCGTDPYPHQFPNPDPDMHHFQDPYPQAVSGSISAPFAISGSASGSGYGSASYFGSGSTPALDQELIQKKTSTFGAFEFS
jgi:hypothetical protein